MVAITGGLCSTPPATMSNAVAVDQCSGTEITLGDCQHSIYSACNKWGGVICTCELLLNTQHFVTLQILTYSFSLLSTRDMSQHILLSSLSHLLQLYPTT